MSSLAILVGLGLGAILLQTFALSVLPSWLRPDLVLVFALAMGLRTRGTSALILAFLFGFIVDVLSGSPLGLFSLLRGTACAAARIVDRVVYLRAPIPWALFVVGYVCVDALLIVLWQRVFIGPEVAWASMLLGLPGQAIFTAALAVPLLSVFLRLDSDLAGDRLFSLAPPPASRARL